MAGFSARLTAAQAAGLRRDGDVVSVRPARRFRIASEVVPDGVRRVKGAPITSPTPDVDADIAILDTGIGPVGGGELNIAGGINCSGDGYPPEAWQDLYPVRHGTHVAGIAAARDGNGVGVVGTAPGARLWAVRIFDEGGWGDESTVLCGLDWVTATRVPGLAPLGSQPIEVANMSIEGSRINVNEECLPGDPDLIHTAICAAFRAGITIVAAAGNGATDAGAISPAGYDQVITVGAITDLDGVGWGEASTGCSGEQDDSWASYSNHGHDVDILAPGSCVESLEPSETGDATKRMTGTSMAAPHVTGAVARYLAAHPSSPPEQVRKLVRAAGRLDWHMRTDPDWSGVADRDPPARLLDVAALTGPGELRVWLSTDGFRIARGAASRQVRVDVQRGGGYAGGVRLKVVGLKPGIGSARFDRPGPRLKGLNGLGARLSLRLNDGGGGRRQVRVTARGGAGTLSGSRTLGLPGHR
jgi:subtilisin family serine protease